MNSKRIKTIIRYGIRLAPVVVVVAALAWFFWFRPSGGQTNTAETTETEQSTPETTVSATEPESATKPEEKVATSGDTLAAATTPVSDLPTTGPGDMAALFALTAAAGTLFWEWRLRRKHYTN